MFLFSSAREITHAGNSGIEIRYRHVNNFYSRALREIRETGQRDNDAKFSEGNLSLHSIQENNEKRVT